MRLMKKLFHSNAAPNVQSTNQSSRGLRLYKRHCFLSTKKCNNRATKYSEISSILKIVIIKLIIYYKITMNIPGICKITEQIVVTIVTDKAFIRKIAHKIFNIKKMCTKFSCLNKTKLATILY